MAIVHLVLIQFKDGTDPNVVHKLCSQLLDLKKNCVHSESGEPYIMNFTGGANSSTEGLSAGFTHAFSAIFASEDDRNYYAQHDPVHLNFKQDALNHIEKIAVVDYEPNAF